LSIVTIVVTIAAGFMQQEISQIDLDSDTNLKFTPLYFNWVLIHPKPKGIIYFIGGAGFGSFPTIFYRFILRRLFEAGYTIIALPFRFTFRHWSVALSLVRDAKPLREAIEQQAKYLNRIHGREIYTNLDLYSDPQKFKEGNYFWLGHSLGCKYIALLELLGDVDRLELLGKEDEKIDSLLKGCIKNEKRVKRIKQLLQNIKDSDYVSLYNQPSILIAPVITGIEGAIPIKQLADLVKPFLDARPSKEETECLIAQNNLFHFTSIVKFKEDLVEAKAGTINFLRRIIPQKPFPLLFQELEGKHLAPLNLLRNNEALAELLIEWLPILSSRVRKSSIQNKPEPIQSVNED
jgi:Protein of unknown function (DUF1350)